MNKGKNPFTRNRAEQMGEDTWRYYVKEPFTNLLSEKPLIFEGSRGCGKTMFFLCNSWKEKFAEYESQNLDISEIFSKTGLIGFYYKIDGKFVGRNLSKKGVEDWEWQSIFNTYFNIIVSKDILKFLEYCLNKRYIIADDVRNLISRINAKIEFATPKMCVKATNSRFDNILDEIEAFSNDPEKRRPLGLHAGTLINIAVEELRKIRLFEESRFHVFIDEFEELNASQQKQINTLLKQSKFWLVYDIGVKTKGRHTEETISGEIIQEPDDYVHFYPEINSYERKEEYDKLLVSICAKRISDCLPASLRANTNYLDIRFYLMDYGKDIELKEFEQSPKMPSLRKKLKRMIDEDNGSRHFFNADEIKEVYSVLVDCSPDLVRMHIAILNRRSKISIKNLFQHAKENTKVYQDWRHNMTFATYYLLCRELDVIKKYHGLSTFSMLSSGVIRSFLEICESAFDYAFTEGFAFDNPRSLTIDEQTNAAHYVSQSKVSKIEGFVPDGMYLKRFILALGKIFYLRHTDADTTLGEPEPNHFYTKPLELKSIAPEAMRILQNAILHNVLQFDLPTKEKNTDAIETTDFHINHIYCPYFKISHRRKRKIFLDPTALKTLLVGSSMEVDKVVRTLASKSQEDPQGKFNFNGDDLSGEV